MLIRRGWASEYAKRKFDIELDEADLVRILAVAGVADPAGVAATMNLGHVYEILDAEAMMFVSHTLSRFEPASKDTHMQAYAAYQARRDTVLAGYRPVQDPPA
jgi:hypothetical protein